MSYQGQLATVRTGRWFSLVLKFAAAGVVLVLTPSFSLDLQAIGGVLVLQILPTVLLGVMTGWFHRWALMVGLLVGLASSLYLLRGRTLAVRPWPCPGWACPPTSPSTSE